MVWTGMTSKENRPIAPGRYVDEHAARGAKVVKKGKVAPDAEEPVDETLPMDEKDLIGQ